MPKSKQVNPEFQQALKDAIKNFKEIKAPLWAHHLEEIAVMENIVNNSLQTNRELRDNARSACIEINKGWRHWFVKSLLANYIEAVLNNPRFNVERMYEGVIDQQGEVIGLQEQVIKQLEQKNDRLETNLPVYADELREKLKLADSALAKATEQQKKSDEQSERSNKMIETLNTKLEERERNYQSLFREYLQTVNGKRNVMARKKFNIRAETDLNVARGSNIEGISSGIEVGNEAAHSVCR
jgi:hypothetical protein